MKKKALLPLLLMLYTASFAQSKSTLIVDTPTAYTIGKGTYKISMLGYDNGGAELKTILGLIDNLYLGVSFDVQNLIGKDQPHPNVPGVIAKVKVTDGLPGLPIALGLGYDSFYIGSEGRTYNSTNQLNRMIYGPYIAFSGTIYLFESEQYLTYGLRVPTQPYYVPKDTSHFVSLDIPFGESFRIMLETSRVYWNMRRSREWMYNVGAKYTYLDHLGVEIAVLFEQHQKPNRIIRIEYHDQF